MERATGRIRFLSDEEAYGFIERDGYGQDVFLHRADVVRGEPTLDARVSFRTQTASRGPRARDIVIEDSTDTERA